jgi:electron transfer flavoprotein beta subunit
LKVAVLVKEVPATDKVKMDEKTGTMIRSEMESELNPLDMYAVEEAVRLKEKFDDVKVTVISMGPPGVVKTIKEAIAMGCDEGYLLSDRAFAGADTLATAYALSAALRKVGEFDLVFTGERATDGETGQVGPSVATQLGIPVVTYVSEVVKVNGNTIRVKRSIEGGKETIEVETPVLLSVVKEINEPRISNLSGKLSAKAKEIPLLTANDIDAPKEKLGLGGSPTRVVKVFYPKLSREGKMIKMKDAESAVDELVKFMKEKGVI